MAPWDGGGAAAVERVAQRVPTDPVWKTAPKTAE